MEAKTKLKDLQLNGEIIYTLLLEEEETLLEEYKLLCERENMELRQKAENEWPLFGHRCSKVFYKIIKAERNKSSLRDVSDSNDGCHQGQVERGI